ncbi:MAG: thermonuclease family protein [Thermoplasmata archaeon]|nr:MAG: thermonuclease family protein [Thermoplasmata archaeon]
MIKRILIIGIIAILVLAGYFIMRDFSPSSDETFDVSEIIDGDTIRLSNDKRVRLIGINAPEKDQPYYDDATEKLKELIGDGPVKLKKDVDDEDQYGRWLRYIYVNKTFVNLEMVKEGCAIAYEFQPNVKYSEEFKEAEGEAREAGIGIWVPSSFSITISILNADAEGDDTKNLNDEYVVFANEGTTSLNMTHWLVLDQANNHYRFQEFELEAGSFVTLHSGSGVDTEVDIYWASPKPIWNNDGDTLYLRDAEDLFVTHYSY